MNELDSDGRCKEVSGLLVPGSFVLVLVGKIKRVYRRGAIMCEYTQAAGLTRVALR